VHQAGPEGEDCRGGGVERVRGDLIYGGCDSAGSFSGSRRNRAATELRLVRATPTLMPPQR